MKIAIMQPTYLPWLGYFDLMDRADHFVFLDTVQFSKQSWQQRNRIKTHQGTLTLTVPVVQKLGQRVSEVRIDNRNDWQKKHWRSIESAYQKAPFWSEFSPALAPFYEKKWEFLCDMNAALITCLKDLLGIATPLTRVSGMDLGEEGRSGRLVNICKRLNGTLYLSPAGAREYLTEDRQDFEAAGLAVEFQEYQHPRYPQLHGEFVPQLSVIDPIFNAGRRSLDLIRGQRPSKVSS